MSTRRPRVSIGLPVFNGELYLEQAIDSILAQTLPDFELIISDNASTDRTQAVAQAYAAQDHRIRYYRNEHNTGAAPNFNKVFELSRADYFKWAAHDDVIAPDFLAACVEVLERDEGVVLCYSKAQLIDEHGRVFESYSPRPDVCAIMRPSSRFGALILHPHLALQQFGVLRSASLRQTRIHQSFPSSDEVLLAELALLGRFAEIPAYLFQNRVHEQQSTRGALTVQRARVAWFDTSLQGRIVLAHWMYFGACMRVIQNAPINAREKAACYLHMARWLAVPSHFRAMGKDVLLAGQKRMRLGWAMSRS